MYCGVCDPRIICKWLLLLWDACWREVWALWGSWILQCTLKGGEDVFYQEESEMGGINCVGQWCEIRLGGRARCCCLNYGIWLFVPIKNSPTESGSCWAHPMLVSPSPLQDASKERAVSSWCWSKVILPYWKGQGGKYFWQSVKQRNFSRGLSQTRFSREGNVERQPRNQSAWRRINATVYVRRDMMFQKCAVN